MKLKVRKKTMSGQLNYMECKKIRDGLSVYQRDQDTLIGLIRENKELTETKFDEVFYKKPEKLRPINGDSFLLGMGENGFTERAFQLTLLQHMVALGDVMMKMDAKGKIVYFLPEE